MYKHPNFDLLMHDDGEMEKFINGLLYSRITLHEWPLSCVQRIVHYDARRYIYKSQSGPTVEPEFYAAVQSPLLVNARTLYRDERYAIMLLEHLEPPRLDELGLSEREAYEVTLVILDQINRMRGKPPVYIDIGTQAKWVKLVKNTLAMLKKLVKSGSFQQVDDDLIERLKECALGEDILSLFEYPASLLHGDLCAENIFLLQRGKNIEDRLRVVDWQRPLRGPVLIDQVTLLESLKVDPSKYTYKGAVQARDFLTVRWYAECAARWVPAAAPTYDRMIAELIAKG